VEIEGSAQTRTRSLLLIFDVSPTGEKSHKFIKNQPVDISVVACHAVELQQRVHLLPRKLFRLDPVARELQAHVRGYRSNRVRANLLDQRHLVEFPDRVVSEQGVFICLEGVKCICTSHHSLQEIFRYGLANQRIQRLRQVQHFLRQAEKVSVSHQWAERSQGSIFGLYSDSTFQKRVDGIHQFGK
jgi:hypothetical protein